MRDILEELERLDRAIVAVNAELDGGARRAASAGAGPDRPAADDARPLPRARSTSRPVLPSSTDPYRLAFPARTVFGELVAEADRPSR